jgi:hypothetical protein
MFIHRQPSHRTAKLKFAMLITDLLWPFLIQSLFTSTANVPLAGIKSQGYMNGHYILIFIGLPGPDILPGSRFWLLTW